MHPILDPAAAQARTTALVKAISQIVLGKEHVIRLAVATLLARGHLLFEDLPGVGKTTLAHALARALGLSFRRVQFTSDMLPADIIGASVFDKESNTFIFKPGPLFTQVLLADEINRATPKTQSALLEAMEENQVSADGITHALPEPFFVIATQNPLSSSGTFHLPESQLDRFLMRLQLGIPDREAERALLAGEDRRSLLAALPSTLSAGELQQLQQLARSLHVSPALLDYVQDLLASSRQHGHGLSPRAGLAILSAAKAWALMGGRKMVIPEDVQATAPTVIAHRLDHCVEGVTGVELAREILGSTAVL